MAQVAMTVRLDSDVKMKFDKLCEEFGMSANTAFNVFVNAVIRNRCIPFTIEAG
ncbi:MAG: type II toxin-antitoxin system RelB/DinJ family antitoxin [Marinilabiliaceae bacterium]|nr:type II toxin-antitoxin system RelB/DinJ family antitoxin [Marinilabiliaceae bacterium]